MARRLASLNVSKAMMEWHTLSCTRIGIILFLCVAEELTVKLTQIRMVITTSSFLEIDSNSFFVACLLGRGELAVTSHSFCRFSSA